MPVKILVSKPTTLDNIVLHLSACLLERFGDNIVCVERIDDWEGSNVRIVVRDIRRMREIIEAIARFEEERGIVGTIIPEILSEDEYYLLRKDEQITLDDKTFRAMKEFLMKNYGDVIVHIERIDGWEGSNVRIVVRDIRRMREIIEAIARFEEERGIVGTIIPEIVKENET